MAITRGGRTGGGGGGGRIGVGGRGSGPNALYSTSTRRQVEPFPSTRPQVGSSQVMERQVGSGLLTSPQVVPRSLRRPPVGSSHVRELHVDSSFSVDPQDDSGLLTRPHVVPRSLRRPHIGSSHVRELQVDSSFSVDPQNVPAPTTTQNPPASSGSPAANVTSTDGLKRRGSTYGEGTRKAMRKAKKRLTVQFDFSLLQAICSNAECFNNEIGYIVRKYCTLRYKDWRFVPTHVRAPLRHKLLTLFDIDVEDDNIIQVIDVQMNKAWKGFKCKLHKYFKDIGGEHNPLMAKKRCPEEISQQDWDYLCDLWVDPKYLEKSQKNIEARGKRKSKTRNGSKKTARHHVQRGAELDSPSGHIETWRLLVWHSTKGWEPPELEAKYEEMMEWKRENPQMTDKEILEKVLGRESVRLFGWGRSPSKSKTTRTDKESSRPTYNQLLNELNQYKTRFEELEGGYKTLCNALVEKNIIQPSHLPSMVPDHSSRPSDHGAMDDFADYAGEYDDII